jgi:DNA-binding NtrC family response regulator
MILDDDERLASVIARLLEACGYETTYFSHPQDAIGAMRSEPARFDAVITDFSMPQMSLDELVAELRGVREDVIVIVSTGKPWALEEADRVRLGITEVLGKPWRLDEAIEVLERVLRPHRHDG